MVDAVKRRATYQDVLERWSPLGTYADDARIRAEPFDAIELELGLLWADVQSPEPTR